MTDESDNEQQVMAEIRQIDETLRRLRAERGPLGDEVGDQSDDATEMTSYEEEQALIDNLEARRRTLTAELERK